MSQHHPLRRGALSAAGITALSVLILAGCSGTGGSREASSAPSSGSFRFMYATSLATESPYETLGKQYMEENPGVQIEFEPTPNDSYGQVVTTQLQAGNGADVIQTTPGAGDPRGVISLAEAGFLEPLNQTAEKLVPSGAEPLFQIDGKTYGQALDFTVNTLVASMGTASAIGLSQFPTTMDDFLANCSQLAAEGKSMIALAGAAGPNTGLTAQAISATRVYAEDPDWNQKRADGDVTFATSQGWKDTLQTIIDLNQGGCFQPGAEGGGFEAITNGLAQGTSVSSFIPSGAAVEVAKAAPKEADFKVQPFPPADGGKPFVVASSNYTLSINATSEEKDAARAFLDWMATPEAQQSYYELAGELPITQYQDIDLSDTIYSEIPDLLSEGSYTPLPAGIWPNASVYEALQKGVQGLLTGQETIDQVLQNMDSAWDR